MENIISNKNDSEEIWYEVFCGSYEAMKMIADRGAKALNSKTHKFQVIDKNAQYKIRIDNVLEADNNYKNKYGVSKIVCATLLSNKNLRKLAKKKNFII